MFVEPPSAASGKSTQSSTMHSKAYTPRGENEEFFLNLPQPHTPRPSFDASDDDRQSGDRRNMHSAGLHIRDPVQPDNNPGASCFRIAQVSDTFMHNISDSHHFKTLSLVYLRSNENSPLRLRIS